MQPSAISNPVRLTPLSERVELIKWLGVVLMLWDHSKYLGGGLPAWQVMGRGAYPLFALAFGYALSVVPDSRQLLVRLLYMGLIAECVGAWTVTGDGDLNVLFSFALVAWLEHSRRAGASPAGWFLRIVVVLAVSPLVEYGAAGLALTAVASHYWRRPDWIRAALLAVASLLLLVPNYSFLGTWWLLAALVLLQAPIGLPRIPRVFYWVYVGQWPLLWVLS